MTRPARKTLFEAIDATWPAQSYIERGNWLIREGAGGGNRVSAATVRSDAVASDLSDLEAGQAALGQTALVMVRGGDEALDSMLEGAGYRLKDPVELRLGPTATLATQTVPLAAVPSAQCLGVQDEIWDAGGIGPARRAIMERVDGPKTWLLGRDSNRPCGTAFVAIHEGVAMVHALEVAEFARRRGVAANMMRGAAKWAQDNGAEWISALVTAANAPARALYTSLGMQAVENYHYREKGS